MRVEPERPAEVIVDQERAVHAEHERKPFVWTPHPDVLREYEYVKAFVKTWNPMPAMRQSYREFGWAWQLLMWLLFLRYVAMWWR